MSLLKKIITTLILTAAIILIPAGILVSTVNADNDFSLYILVYFFIIIALCGYIVVSVHSSSKEIRDALDEMKMQNAAIAYKLTNSNVNDEETEEVFKKKSSKKQKDKKETVEKEEKVDTSNVNLNPADPLMIDGKVVSDNFDDFK
jgi:cytoskeletal protein RodZ